MNWPHLNLRRGDIHGIVFVAVLLGAVILALLFVPKLEQNFGFGPEWQCARMEQGDPICVRLVDKNRPK
ncbi:hypothetical protein [Mesorhizobium sp. B1-1-8]|uniref:hypothetical protein n=1 Tax=Mesorhizobium sp. B1-1-8 TaxID=2589976 RepID=UPI0011286E2D|nr:hypothetical protein [Mesorhizobium sp. B1-1-8]UCI06574.1 hypothetical protein FJ974_22595 [Mesorhizobium sp. B1-1-8]